MNLRRFWLEFDVSINDDHPIGVLVGCGVTAYDYEDAVRLIRERVFNGGELPTIRKAIEDVDLSALDADHVLVNMGIPSNRGVWFPLGYE